MCSFYALSLFFLFLYALVVHYARDCSCMYYRTLSTCSVVHVCVLCTFHVHVHVHVYRLYMYIYMYIHVHVHVLVGSY